MQTTSDLSRLYMKSAITLKRSRLQKRISFKKLDISHQKEKLEAKAPHTQNKFFKNCN